MQLKGGGKIKAYEFPVKVTPEGNLHLPEDLVAELPAGQLLRVIILVPEQSDSDEAPSWPSLTAEQFFAGYSEADSIYDTI